MLHRLAFQDSKVAYANKFLQSADYRKAQEQGRITQSGFATDLCRSIFARFFNLFLPDPPPERGAIDRKH
jgi:hypothetical protein